MTKSSLDNGKWKKIINQHNKKLVALALAGTLMGTQIPGSIEQVEASQVSVTSATATNSSAFLTAVRRMDNLAAIKQMNVKSLGDISDSVTTARSIYDKLPAEAKADKGVLRWEGYLTQKEEGIANRFVALSAQLPTNNQMERMSANDLVVARSRINKIRNLHSKLPTNAKMNSGVNRWEGYLTQKEDAAGITFVNAARALPSVAEIKEMNEEELLKYYEEAEKVKDAFNSLSDTAKSNTQVSTWDTYLATKEDAVYEVAEKLEVELPERAPNDKVEDEGSADEKEPEVPETPVDPEPEVTEPEVTDPEVSTKTRTETETVAFGTVGRYNANLPENGTRVAQEGVNGERTITYEQTYIRGEFDSEKQVSSEITKQPVNRIVEVGTKKKITWGTETKTLVIPFNVEVIEVTYLPVGQEWVEVEGQNGQRDIVYEQTFVDGVLVYEKLLSDTVTREPVTKVVYLGVEQDKIVLDQQVFSQELLNLVNELRVSVGVHKLTYDNTLQQGANIRAREVLDVFSHTRPDGRHFITAFGYEEPNYYLGENIAYNYIYSKDYKVDTLERNMAKKFFNQYYNSEGHYNNMISDRYVTFATGVTLGENRRVSNAQIFGGKNR